MKMLPAPSTATPHGDNSAEIAGPPSPLKPAVPFPATGLIGPAGVTFRMLFEKKSDMKRLPAPSTATPSGITDAKVAGPPSPLDRSFPLPATVLIVPAVKRSVASVRRDRLLKKGCPYIKIGSSVRYLPSDVEAWLGSLPSRGRHQDMPASAS